jgi:ADP-ribosylglycohydrolase
VADCGGFDRAKFGQAFFQLVTSRHYPGYRDKATKQSADAWKQAVETAEDFDYQQGADDNEPATATRLAPIIALHGHEDRLDSIIEEAVRIVQDNEEAVAYNQLISNILKDILDGADFLESVNQVIHQARDSKSQVYQQAAAKLREARDRRDDDVREATGHFGRACPLPKSVPAAAQAVLKHQGDFVQTIRSILNAGGDNAARAAIAGAWLGAEHGRQAIPDEWCHNLNEETRIQAATERIIKSRRGAEV